MGDFPGGPVVKTLPFNAGVWHPHMTTGKTIALTIWTLVGSDVFF